MTRRERNPAHTTKPAMRKHTKARPGIEMDNKGEPIPVEKRMPADREAVHRASKEKRK